MMRFVILMVTSKSSPVTGLSSLNYFQLALSTLGMGIENPFPVPTHEDNPLLFGDHPKSISSASIERETPRNISKHNLASPCPNLAS